MIGAALRRVADAIDPPKPHAPPPYPLRTQARLFDDEQTEARRREDAMRLMDEQTLGYVMFVVRDQGFHAKVEPGIAISDEMFPAVVEALSRFVTAGEHEYGPGAVR
jgi:hypothetical protein